ncbi:MAG: PQQ-binding-like beta-propeller repeat protein [Pseudomonadota bacterium]
MAYCSGKIKQVAISSIILCSCLLLLIPELQAKSSQHLTSHDSIIYRDSSSKWRKLQQTDRRIKVDKLDVIRLKKTSFWSSKPFQFAIPIADDSMIFVGVDAGVFYGIDVKKTKKVWNYKTHGPIQAQAAVKDEVVYFGDIDGYVYALNTKDGKEIWKQVLGDPILAEPLVDQERVYFVTNSSRLFCLNKTNGQEIWHTDAYDNNIGFRVRRGSSPVLYQNMILFGNARGMLMAYRTDGSLGWVKQLGDRTALVSDLDTRPIITKDCIYVATADRHVFCLDPDQNGQVRWMLDDVGGVNDLLLTQDTLYISGDSVLAAATPAQGHLLWEQDLEVPGISSPAIGANVLAVAATKGRFYLVDPLNGDIVFSRYIRGGGSFSDPLFVDDKLVLLSNSGRLYFFKIKEKPPKKKKT